MKQRIGTRSKVMHGIAKRTSGGLRKQDLLYNNKGKIVSKKMSMMAKKERRLEKAGYSTKKGFFQLFTKQNGGASESSILDNSNIEELETGSLKWNKALQFLVPPLLETKTNMNTLFQNEKPKIHQFDNTTQINFSKIQGKDLVPILSNRRSSDIYNHLCRRLYEYKSKGQTLGELYQKYAIQNIKKTEDKKVVLYFNFKSHNIFTKQIQMFSIIEEIKPDIICLSEALVPNKIRDHFKKSKGIYTLKNVKSTIEQPSLPNSPFGKKKKNEHKNYFQSKPNGQVNKNDIKTVKTSSKYTEIKKNKKNGYQFSITSNGIKSTNFNWESKLKDFGYNYLLFSNPTHCTWGDNWGNVIITKDSKDIGEIQMNIPTTKKPGFAPEGVKESRSAVYCRVDNKLIVSTHLEDSIHSIQLEQAKDLIHRIEKLKIKYPSIQKVILVGDMNSLDMSSNTYSNDQKKIIKSLLRSKPKKGYEITFDYMKKVFKGGEVINKGQKFESIYQKCVTHAFSNVKDNNQSYLYFTDVSDFDHQPLILFV